MNKLINNNLKKYYTINLKLTTKKRINYQCYLQKYYYFDYVFQELYKIL